MVRKARSWKRIVKEEGAYGAIMGEDIGPELQWKENYLKKLKKGGLK